MTIGVLALQGDFKEHLASIERNGYGGVEVRTLADLERVNALILPGGESTTMAKLLKSSGLDKKIVQRVKEGMPIWGTCAGAILLAKQVDSPVPLETRLGLLDIAVERNSYGRQTESFQANIRIEKVEAEVFFIRAPRITRVGRGVQVLARYRGDPVFVRSKNILATTFHSELSGENKVLKMFMQNEF